MVNDAIYIKLTLVLFLVLGIMASLWIWAGKELKKNPPEDERFGWMGVRVISVMIAIFFVLIYSMTVGILMLISAVG